MSLLMFRMTLSDQIDALKVCIDHMVDRKPGLSQEKLRELEGYRTERLELINLRVALVPHRDIERHRLRISQACCPVAIECRTRRYKQR